MDHGVTPEKMYDTMPQVPEKIYPHISLPAEAFESGEYQPGHECTITIKVKIKSMDELNYDCELISSEEVEEAGEKEE